jgi:hypothetical protein
MEELKPNVVYLCKYKKASYSTVFEIRIQCYSPNKKCIRYIRKMGDMYNSNSEVTAWVETEHFWEQYELLDQWSVS